MEIQHRVPERVASVRVKLASAGGAQVDESLETFVLRWWEQMRTGKIDRALLSAEYDAHLTEGAVQGMSQYLTAYEYGAAPLGVQVLQSRSTDSQVLHLTKIVFPRGDAASLLFGFNPDGKITGVALTAMAGD